jgi:hypothetical protein
MARLLIKQPDQVFIAHVNYDDPVRHRLFCEGVLYIEKDLQPEHFPIRHQGEADVEFEYVTFDHNPTTQGVFDEIKRQGLRDPDLAETRAFHNAHPEEQRKATVISLCGSVVERRGRRRVAYVDAYSHGLDLYLGLSWRWLDDRLPRFCRFLAVRKS